MRGITLVAILIPLLHFGAERVQAATHDRAARVLEHSTSFRARVQAAFAIGSIEDLGTEPARRRLLAAALRDGHPAVRAAAAASLAKIGDSSSIDALVRLRSDRNPAVRSQSAEAVRKINLRIAAQSPKVQAKQLEHRLRKSGPEVGEVDASIARNPEAVAELLRTILEDELASRRDLRRAREIRINARVVRLDFRRGASGTQLYSVLSLVLVDRDSQNMVGSATARVQVRGSRTLKDRAGLLRETLREASRAALSDLSGVKLALR